MASYYRKRKYRNYDDYDDYDGYDSGPEGIILLPILYLLYLYFTDRAKFWYWLVGIILVITLLIGGYILIRRWIEKKRLKKYIYTANNEVNNLVSSQPVPVDQTTIKNPDNKSTPEAQALYGALIERKIKCELERNDGHKHIDLSIPWARIDIEIDGMQHYFQANQMTSDMKRSLYSARNGFYTIRIPNSVIHQNLNAVADTIANAARQAYFERQNNYFRRRFRRFR